MKKLSQNIKVKNNLNKYSVSEFPKRMLMGLQDGYCNLKCPMCFVHGNADRESIKLIRGRMPFKEACKIFNEVKEARPSISPSIWSEPFIMKDFYKYMKIIKSLNLPIVINTNGLLLTERLSKFLVDFKIDSISFSIDAFTSDTLKKMRGTENIKKIKGAVFKMLDKRKDRPYPRIGVSFTVGNYNNHEKEEFISYWLQYVDVIRVNEEYNHDRSVKNAIIPQRRIPCAAIYDTMAINHNGDVSICCLDSFNTTKMGNVFKDGVKNIWHSEEFKKVRYYHQIGRYEKVPFCRNCVVWSNSIIEEITTDKVLIRKSPLTTHYNRLDKLNYWKVGRLSNANK